MLWWHITYGWFSSTLGPYSQQLSSSCTRWSTSASAGRRVCLRSRSPSSRWLRGLRTQWQGTQSCAGCIWRTQYNKWIIYSLFMSYIGFVIIWFWTNTHRFLGGKLGAWVTLWCTSQSTTNCPVWVAPGSSIYSFLNRNWKLTLVHNPLGEQFDNLGTSPIVLHWVELEHCDTHHILWNSFHFRNWNLKLYWGKTRK